MHAGLIGQSRTGRERTGGSVSWDRETFCVAYRLYSICRGLFVWYADSPVSVEGFCVPCRLYSIGRRLLDLLQITQYLKGTMGWHAGYTVSEEAFCVAFRLHSI